MMQAVRPTNLTELEPRDVIRPPTPVDGTQPADMVVDEVRRNTDGWHVYGHPVARERKRRVTATYPPDGAALVVAAGDTLDVLRNHLANALGDNVTTKYPVLVVDLDPGALTLHIDGWEVTL